MKFSFAMLAGALAAAVSLPAPASAQALSNGDYAQCAVRDREGNFKGYDSVCLERKRLALARLRDRQSYYTPVVPAQPAVFLCPYSANLGAGFATTFWGLGQTPPFAMAYDAPVNGRPCIPNRDLFLPGVN